ncbi:hypothetical protein [Variovorax paradoxus]|uniref:hypothetical protein n=1 Tax=Variovorax paradoxus TaxID=34073 RepID=UPI00278AE49C|nr:hypothetical protein [Variovorax paradoxus]MDQ0586125.1 hypothetical protein [Variovorax paradoxus]
MKLLFSTCALVGAQILAFTACAQTQPLDKTMTRAERKAEGVEAARTFMPGEGDPIPEPKARASKADRAAARQARRPEGVQAARTFMPGEGDPIPTPTAKLSRAERSAGRKASRSEVAKANRAGQLPSYSDNYGGK